MTGSPMTKGLFRSVVVRTAVAAGILLTTFAAVANFGDRATESAAGAARWASVNGHPLYYEMHGSGRPLILLHGGGDSIAGSFAQQMNVLARDHRVIAPEQIGQGHTPDIPSALSYTQMMEDTAELIRQLGVRSADVVGWSDGGNIALMLAAHYPQLVRRVVISGANISPDGLRAKEIDAMREAAREAPTGAQTIDDKLNTLWLTSPRPEELSLAILSTIHQPVLVMSGDHDVIRLEHTLEIYRALPNAQLYILPDTQHGTFAERPQWINPVLQWFLDAGPSSVASSA